MDEQPVPEFSFSVDVTSLPQVGRSYTIKADADARARVAKRLGVREIAALTATFELTPRAGGLVKVAGTVESSLTQACVVTLAPVPASLKEDLETTFTTYPAEKIEAKTRTGKVEEEIEELISLEDEDSPQEALDGQIDLGELAVEHLALALDPYPRAPGASFETGVWGEKGEIIKPDSPFAVLAQLKKKDPPKEGR